MAKMRVIGDQTTVIAFRAIGIEGTIAHEDEEARRCLEQMAAEGTAVIFITEALAQSLSESMERYRRMLVPAVILIPGQHGSLGLATKQIRDNMERAIGVNLL